ncbi:hypothetical protein EJF18_50696 [Clavispora lusitaniae]|uniref:Uncharacterized protein n=1 Tax=Clavispora lusitaniae TaxID=36911 RepID=A0ACD0WQ11_CLALS|nr:hypothetical protein EJF14_50696 [Clavispora lusitaniae]QFZ35117.1 hypothetical protein EJF16_50696 [Clavispora lusitaniae]QFZ40802.1 hypothetical protein EJF15_50696 [Clavispora lusitaniae]QFZ46482.1 hypothetical protein EJF18_50696 [Clavispora lusitaniae]QFZ52144.1 hypothetical protein EJF17_50696 [Clavispora lusitaniae]
MVCFARIRAGAVGTDSKNYCPSECRAREREVGFASVPSGLRHRKPVPFGQTHGINIRNGAELGTAFFSAPGSICFRAVATGYTHVTGKTSSHDFFHPTILRQPHGSASLERVLVQFRLLHHFGGLPQPVSEPICQARAFLRHTRHFCRRTGPPSHDAASGEDGAVAGLHQAHIGPQARVVDHREGRD